MVPQAAAATLIVQLKALRAGFHIQQRDRRRKFQRPFASLGAFSRTPLPGGKPGVQPDSGSGKDKDDGKGQKDPKGGDKEEDKAAKSGRVPLGQLLKEKQNELAEDKPEKPPAARIVAYSDSEGEDEPFRLTRRRKKQKENGEQTEPEEEKPQQEEESSPSTSEGKGVQTLPKQIIRGERRLFKAARSCTRRGVTKLRDEAGWGLVLQFCLLWLFRRWRRKSAKRFELLTLAIALPDALCSATGVQCPSQGLPGRLQALLHFAESWARPAALFQLEEYVQRVLPKKKRRRMLTTISQSVRIFEEAELDAPSPSARTVRSSPRLAAEGAAQYKIELAEMKRILDSQGAKLPSERFDDTQAELYRFAVSAGLLQAMSHEEKAHAIQEGAQRILKTLDWHRKTRLMQPAQLKEWHHMVRWQGTDTDGWPILVIKMAKACAQCQGDSAEAVSEAVVGQMQRALTEVFSNRHGPDKLVVVMDATGANSLQAARNVSLFKQVATTLNKHYPCRLHQLFVVDLPSQLRWVLATLKPLLHATTKEKIRLVSISDPALPLPAQALQEANSEASADEASGGPSGSSRSRRVSIPELPVSSSPPSAEQDDMSRRGSIPAFPGAENHRSRRRVRILELPYREFERKPSSRAGELRSGEVHSPGILRPGLKRSMSAGLIGIKTLAGEDAAKEPESTSRRDEMD